MSVCEYCKHQKRNISLQNKVKELEMALEEFNNTMTRTTTTSNDINEISHSDALILLHTSLK